jgi:hypothetical protein
VSSAGSDFNVDLRFSSSEEQTREWVAPILQQLPPIASRNASQTGTDLVGYLTQSQGFSAFILDNGVVYHIYSTGAREVEFLMGYYPILDRAPKGRDEGDGFQLWIRPHDQYDTQETMDTQSKRAMMSDLSGRTTVVVGASRGLGRGIARAFAEAGAAVVAVARTGPALAELATTSPNIRTEVADAAEETVAWSLLDQYEPEVLILVAGANPAMCALQEQTWETFSVNWHTDVKIAFTWLREHRCSRCRLAAGWWW